jgi:class 3 adenylate cyclase
MDSALKLMIDAAHRYDGYVVQSTGDGILALFGDFVSRPATIGSFSTKSVFVYCPITDPGSLNAPGGIESRDHRVSLVEF